MEIAVIVLSVIAVVLACIIAYVEVRQKRKKKTVAGDEESVSGEAEAPSSAAVRSVAVADEEEEVPVEVREEDNDEAAEETADIKISAYPDGHERYIVIKYDKSFTAKLMQSDDRTKDYYSQIKNCLLSYGFKSRISWKRETFRCGRKTAARLRLRGKTLSVAYALDPAEFENSKFLIEDISDIASYADTPCLYRIKNDKRARYAKLLIARLAEKFGLRQKADYNDEDFAAQFPYDTTENLVERKLIKELTDGEAQSGTVFMPAEIRRSITVVEADSILRDEEAELLIKSRGGVSDKTKTGIVNIDTISRYFSDGDTVTLEELKKRIPDFNKNVTYVKVLARGTLDKKLTVEADNFSLKAVKMIVLTGGKAIKK